MKKFATAFSFVLFTILSFAQNNPCATDHAHKRLLDKDPSYGVIRAQLESELQNFLAQQSFNKSTEDTLTVPLVVHVYHLGEAIGSGTNISDAQIQSAVDNLNVAYSAAGGLETNIRFALAKRDPDCNTTTGIIRTDASGESDYSTNGMTYSNENILKALSKWDNSKYYNIWVVSEINGNNGGAGTQGYAYYPGASSAVDGTVILHNAFGYDPTGALGYNLKSYTDENKTTIHELGHGLNLKHTFQGDDSNDDGIADQCPADTNCNTGDCVADTDPHQRHASVCPDGTNSCTGGPDSNIVHNHMNYSNCRNEFTQGQKDRMRAALLTQRPGLINTLATVEISDSPPIASTCNTSTSNQGNFPIGVYGLTLADINSSTERGYFDGFNNDLSCLYSTELDSNTLYNLTVTTGGTYGEDVKVFIDWNNDGDFDDTSEEVYSDNKTTNDNNPTHIGSFTTPSWAVKGTELRVRVISDYYSVGTITSCGSLTYGQSEDYAVYFQTPASPPVTPPVAGFNSVDTQICARSTAQFTDNSTGTVTSRTWVVYSLTDTLTSNGTNPSFQLDNAGTYSVVLYVSNSGGSDTLFVPNFITVHGEPSVSVATVNETCLGSSDGSATANPSGNSPFSYLWDPGASSQTTQQAGSLSPGTYTVTVTDANNCTNSAFGVVSKDSCSSVDTTSLVICGQTISDVGVYLYCAPRANVTQYQWKVENAGISYSRTYVHSSPTSNYLRLGWLGDVSYGTTYQVSVRVEQDGQWGNYGRECDITVGSMPTTKIVDAQCGSSVSNLGDYIYCDQIVGAEAYEWEITNAGLGYNRTYESSSMYLRLGWFGDISYGETYDIRVRARVNGSWGSYGSSCAITTAGSVPNTKLRDGQCGSTISSIGEYLYADAIGGATAYQWRISNVGLAYSREYTPSNTIGYFRLGWLGDISYGETYDVEVRAQVNGVWGNYGSVCQVTTGTGIPSTKMEDAYCNQTLGSIVQLTYADAVVGATNYEFLIENDGLAYSRSYTSSSSLFRFGWLGDIVSGVTYDVSVRATVNGQTGNYGTVCEVTMPAGKKEHQTGFVDLGSNSLLVYPNPAKDQLNIQIGEEKAHYIEIFDVRGKKVYSKPLTNEQQLIQLSTEEWGIISGLYFVQVYSREGVMNQKILIKK